MKPEVKLAGNMRDLLEQTCVDEVVRRPTGADGWILELRRAGWRILIVPQDGRGAPYAVEVCDPAGSPRYYSSHVATVEEACRKAADVLDQEKVAFNRFDLERFGWAMDRS